MNSEFQKSVVLITSSNPDISRFGTGFVIRQIRDIAYVLTCAHVVRDVGGSENIRVKGIPATLITSGEEDGLDLAILRVEGLWDKPPLNLRVSGENGCPFITAGFQLSGKEYSIRPLQGVLGNQQEFTSPRRLGDQIQAWDLRIVDDYSLQPGYSGSPVVDEKSGDVLGVVRQRLGEGRSGVAISIAALARIWKMIDSEQLYRTLLKLGYRKQVRLFRQLIDNHSVAAFLIHGAPEYGQRWLLNRLVTQYLPNSITHPPVKVHLARKVRRSDVSALWHELGRRVGLRERVPSPSKIAERVYQWWQTQNVLIVFHDVDFLTPDGLHELLYNFWLPLASQAREAISPTHPYKLLMFLVDYEGSAGSWDAPFAEKLDAIWQPHIPIKSPRIAEFSDEDLTIWMDVEYGELPSELTSKVDEAVRAILENSDDGIPERTLEEICDRCGFDWYEESEKWMRL